MEHFRKLFVVFRCFVFLAYLSGHVIFRNKNKEVMLLVNLKINARINRPTETWKNVFVMTFTLTD